MSTATKPTNLHELRGSGWVSKTVKEEIRQNFLRALSSGEDLFPGIVGYQDTVIPEINIALIAGHDLLFLGEKGQAKSRLMRLLVQFLDEEIPYLDLPGVPVHEDPSHRSRRPASGSWRNVPKMRSPSSGGIATIATLSGLRPAPSSPT